MREWSTTAGLLEKLESSAKKRGVLSRGDKILLFASTKKVGLHSESPTPSSTRYKDVKSSREPVVALESHIHNLNPLSNAEHAILALIGEHTIEDEDVAVFDENPSRDTEKWILHAHGHLCSLGHVVKTLVLLAENSLCSSDRHPIVKFDPPRKNDTIFVTCGMVVYYPSEARDPDTGV